jgi:hypothetical protein
MNVNGKLIDEWNLANTKARLAYHRQEGIQSLPGSLNHRTAGIHGWPTREWLLDALADCELAEARAAAAERLAEAALKELGLALAQIEELTGVKFQA